MILFLLVLIGAIGSLAALCALWWIPDSALGRGPKVMMMLFVAGLAGFLVWIVYVARHAVGAAP